MSEETPAQRKARFRAEAWKRGFLDYKLHAGQKRIDSAFRAAKSKLFVALCARRLGKTFWDTDVAIETALKIPNARIKYVAAFLTDLEEYAIPAFQLALKDCPKPITPNEIRTKKKWRFKNGSEIKLVGLDKNPNGMRGNYADLVVFSEAGLIRRLKYLYSDVCLPMTLYRPWARVIMDGTPPETPEHEFKGFYERAELDGSSIRLTIYDNPLLTQANIKEIYDECMKLPGGEITWKREYLAEFVIDVIRAICPEWDDVFVQDPPRPNLYQFLRKYESMDLGVVDQTVTHFGYYDFANARFVFEDEIMMNGPEMTTDILGEAIKSKEAELWTDPALKKVMDIYRRTCDNNNLLLVNDLGKKSLYFNPTDKDLLHQMVNKLRMWVKAGRVIVSTKCQLLRGCLKNGIWNERRTEFAMSDTYGHYDALASAMYMIRSINETDNPIPPTYGISDDTHIILERLKKKENPNAEALKKAFRLNR